MLFVSIVPNAPTAPIIPFMLVNHVKSGIVVVTPPTLHLLLMTSADYIFLVNLVDLVSLV